MHAYWFTGYQSMILHACVSYLCFQSLRELSPASLFFGVTLPIFSCSYMPSVRSDRQCIFLRAIPPQGTLAITACAAAVIAENSIDRTPGCSASDVKDSWGGGDISESHLSASYLCIVVSHLQD